MNVENELNRLFLSIKKIAIFKVKETDFENQHLSLIQKLRLF